MKTLAIASLSLALSAGCGADRPDRPTHRALVDLDEHPGDRLTVATVNGVPVYDDCVRTQVAELDTTVDDAIDQCVEFEVLAQAARPRYGADLEVHETRRREAARALIEKEFKPTADEPGDVPASWIRDNMWAKREVKFRYQHPEYRVAAYALAKYKPIGKQRILTPQHDAERRSLAEDWHRALEGRGQLSVEEFHRIVTEVAGDRPFDFVESYNTPLEGRSVPGFANALFALEKPGQLSRPAQSKYGYFIIYLREIIPPKNQSFEEAVPDLQRIIYTRWRNLAFDQFVDKLTASADISTHEEALEGVRIDIPEEFDIGK